MDAVERLYARIGRLIGKKYNNADCRRFVKRIRWEGNMLFTFIITWTDYHNNSTEQAIRPNAVIRKSTFGNRSWEGTDAHVILMSIKETCKKRDINFYDFLAETLQDSIQLHKS